MTALYVILGVAGLIIIWLIMIYNQLVRKNNLVQEGWSGIDVQLKRRSNLIPNLIEAVKGYMGHERELLEEVTRLRTQSMNAGTVEEQGIAEGLLGRALGKLIAVAENYPDLKASTNFQELQNSLEDTEDQIEMARRYYNGTARDLNIAIQSFPNNLVARKFGFTKADYFEIEDANDRAVPKVSF